jgi:hypothetical protein
MANSVCNALKKRVTSSGELQDYTKLTRAKRLKQKPIMARAQHHQIHIPKTSRKLVSITAHGTQSHATGWWSTGRSPTLRGGGARDTVPRYGVVEHGTQSHATGWWSTGHSPMLRGGSVHSLRLEFFAVFFTSLRGDGLGIEK